MTNHRSFIVFFNIFFSLVFTLNVNAQEIRTEKDSLLNAITNIDKRIKAISVIDTATVSGYSIQQIPDSILIASGYSRVLLMPRDANGLIIMPENKPTYFDPNITFADTIIFDPRFLPVTFEGKILPDDLNFLSKDSLTNDINTFHLIDREETFAPLLDQTKNVEEMRRYYYMRYPLKVKLNALKFDKSPVIDQEVVEKKSPFKELITADHAIDLNTPEVEKINIKKVYWLKNGEHSLQMSHNSMSDNWNGTGGDESYFVKNYHKINLRYKKNKVEFNNTFEWRMNFQRTPADTVHSISMQDDFFRSYSTLGLQAFKKWSYTMTLEVKTPLFNSYPRNSKSKKTALFSPLNVNTGIGMSYNLNKQFSGNKHRKINLSIDLKPLSINYTYVEDRLVDETKFSIEKGKKAKTDYGSTVNLNSDLYFNRYTRLVSRMKYFSNYEKVIGEFENTLNFELNKYLTTSINLNLRFDDSIPVKNKDEKWGYFQYNETLSFGLSYKW